MPGFRIRFNFGVLTVHGNSSESRAINVPLFTSKLLLILDLLIAYYSLPLVLIHCKGNLENLEEEELPDC
jgi:hypothetical protein